MISAFFFLSGIVPFVVRMNEVRFRAYPSSVEIENTLFAS